MVTQTPAVATLTAAADTLTPWTPHRCSIQACSEAAPPHAYAATRNAPAVWPTTRQSSASTCSTLFPRDCVWCVATLPRGTTMGWPPVRPAKPFSKGRYKVFFTSYENNFIFSYFPGGWILCEGIVSFNTGVSVTSWCLLWQFWVLGKHIDLMTNSLLCVPRLSRCWNPTLCSDGTNKVVIIKVYSRHQAQTLNLL